jgi:hypothetical protein
MRQRSNDVKMKRGLATPTRSGRAPAQRHREKPSTAEGRRSEDAETDPAFKTRRVGHSMARRAFFGFHFERDVWRAGQVRNSWVTKDRESAGFGDAAAWEEVKKKTEAEIEKWIGKQLEGTAVTVVLIGAATSERTYVGYEIKQSYNKGNVMLGIYIHNTKD